MVSSPINMYIIILIKSLFNIFIFLIRKKLLIFYKRIILKKKSIFFFFLVVWIQYKITTKTKLKT